jgi:MFS family permease
VSRPALTTGLMTLAYMVNYMNQGIVLVVAEQLKADFALTDAQLGSVIGLSYMLFSAVGAVPLGRLADLHPRGVVVGLSLALMGVATAVTAAVQGFWSLITLRAVAGAGDAGVLPGAVSMITDHVGSARRPFALSVFNAGASVGAIIVYFFVGHIAQQHGWRTAYWCVGLLGVVVGLAVGAALRDPPRAPAAQMGARDSVHAFLRLSRIKPYWHIVAALIALGMTSSATWNWVSPVLQRTYGFSMAEAGALLGLGAGIATALGSVFFGSWASRLRVRSASAPARVAAAMQLLSAVCLVCGLSTDSVPWMSTFIIAGFFFAGSGMVIVFSTLQEVVPADSRGLAVGAAVLLFSLLGQGLGPLITGVATDCFASYYGGNALRVVMQMAAIAGTAWVCVHLLIVANALVGAAKVEAA